MRNPNPGRGGAPAALLALLAALLLLGPPAHAGSLRGVVNVNTASAEQLTQLPGVGEARARAIVSERKRRGGFKHVEELLEVKGIGEAGLARLKPFVALAGETTLRSD